MINFLNKLLSKFNLELSSKQEQEQEEKVNSFLDDISSPEFVKKHPEFLNRYLNSKKHKDLHVGDIEYLQDKNGKTYYQDSRNQTYYCDYDLKNTSQEVLGHMIKETTFTKEELKKKLKND
jgi:hypothetical protein